MKDGEHHYRCDKRTKISKIYADLAAKNHFGTLLARDFVSAEDDYLYIFMTALC